MKTAIRGKPNEEMKITKELTVLTIEPLVESESYKD
jgi:hypothetical protein